MDLTDILFKYAIPIVSIVFGVYQYKKRARIEEYVTVEAFGYYRDSALLLGSIKRCFEHMRNSDFIEARDEVGISVGLIETLYNASVRNVHHHTHYDESVLTTWIENGKIDQHHKTDFMRYI